MLKGTIWVLIDFTVFFGFHFFLFTKLLVSVLVEYGTAILLIFMIKPQFLDFY